MCDGLFSLWNLLPNNKLIRDESFMKQAHRRLATIVAGALLFAAQPMVATAQSGSQPGAKKPAPVTLPPPAPVTLPPNGAPAVREAITPPTDYVIGPDDVLGIVFWREKELSADVVVRPDGKISLPLLDEISVVGLTPAELRAKVWQRRTNWSRTRMPRLSSRRSTVDGYSSLARSQSQVRTP